MLDHTIGSPLALASKPYSQKAWMPFSAIPALRVPNLNIIQGSVFSVSPSAKTATIRTSIGEKEEDYDYLIAASGLRRVFPVVPQSFREKDYLQEAGEQIEKIRSSKEGIVVIGGGRHIIQVRKTSNFMVEANNL
jgi:NADH dehydrogenase FAD-containing subunit